MNINKLQDREALLKLARAVRSMRMAQKHYFRTRAAADLEHSKRVEKEVDALVDTVLSFRTPSFLDAEPAADGTPGAA